LPREKTWVMEPFPVPSGAPANANVLTIDIPAHWEDTSAKGSIGPNFWVRTGCRYDVSNGLTQCETGGCSGFYDFSGALFGPPAGATLAEWTFYQSTTIGGNAFYLELPPDGAWSRPANTGRRAGSVQWGVPTQTLGPHRGYDASHTSRSSVVRLRHLGC
jgi:hypothetical protein